MIIKGYELLMTCGACPEQYDVYRNGKIVGYLRLRHGYFTASYPECGGEIVYATGTIGDGIFVESERYKHLKKAIKAINKKIANKVA